LSSPENQCQIVDLLSRCYRIKEKIIKFGDKDDDYQLFSSVAFTMRTKNIFFCLILTAGTFTSAFKDKKLLKSHKTVKH
jgi:hypothetical protein